MTSKKDTEDSRFDIDALCALVELPRRTVRYYIQQGLIDRPIGEKRAAYYTPHHLEQLLVLRKWQQAGLSLERIREILGNSDHTDLPPPRPRGSGSVEVWSHLVVAEGLEVTLEPGQAGLSPEQVRTFFRGVMALYLDITQDEDKE